MLWKPSFSFKLEFIAKLKYLIQRQNNEVGYLFIWGICFLLADALMLKTQKFSRTRKFLQANTYLFKLNL